MGNEGVVGVSLFTGGDTTPSSAVVQTAGHAYRLERQRLKLEFDRAGVTQHLLLRYSRVGRTTLGLESVRLDEIVSAYFAAGATSGAGGGVPASRVTSSR